MNNLPIECHSKPTVAPDVIRDAFVAVCDELIRTPRDLVRINARLQSAIEQAERFDSPWMTDLLDLKQRINSNHARRVLARIS